MNNDKLARNYVIGLMAWMLAYAGLLVGTIYAIRYFNPEGPLLYALSILPSLPIGGSIWHILRHIEKSDEYVRAVLTRRFIITTGVTLFVTTAWGFLALYAKITPLDLYLVYALFWGLFGVISIFVRQAK